MLSSISRTLQKHWFLCCLVFVIWLARTSPEIGATGGILHPEVTVKYIAVSVIFLNSGLSLKGEELLAAVGQVRLHSFIQGFSLLCAPLLFSALAAALDAAGCQAWMGRGLKAVGCLPPPVSSAVLLTRVAGGNQAAAIFNSAFGSFLGVIWTPLLLLYFLGATSAAPMDKVVKQLGSTVVLPLIVGQLIRAFCFSPALRGVPFGTINSVVLLLIIFNTFCDTFSRPDISVEPSDLVVVIITVALMQLALTYAVFRLARLRPLRFSPGDVVAATFCSTHKSLTLGIPVLRVVFGGDSSLSLLTLPLLVYHPSQILLGSLLAPSLQSWLAAEIEKKGRFFKEQI